jgi:glycosyltransferase involved in cell wall biosynthesis
MAERASLTPPARLGSTDMRLAIYCDYSYRLDDGELYAELPFGLFAQELAPRCERLVFVGRLDPTPGRFPFRIRGAGFMPLPSYTSGAHLREVLQAIPASARSFWRALDDLDTVWILGPNPPQALLFSLLALLRRRRLVLGVRQNLPELIRHRHPGRRLVQFAASTLEGAWRALALLVPIVVVGPDLARRYRHARSVHVTYVSLLSDSDITPAEQDHRRFDGPELRMLSVGRLDAEKNPLLLARILALSVQADERWQLHICGEGTETDALLAELDRLGVASHATLHGYVPIDDGLWDQYRESHVLLHVSLTEGVPQVLLEAFAARLPVVATAVGGVPALVEGCGLLVPVDDAPAAAEAIGRLASDGELRARYVEAAAERVREHTLGAQCDRLAAFLSGRR